MISVRRSEDRGHASFGWLDSRHTFSFGSYYDPAHMGFSALRVINDDQVTPGAGFGAHGHRDMEIISYVLEGNIAHKDSAGNIAVLPAGEFQLMSAGSGIMHSEFNASDSQPLKFLQIWIQPNVYGQPPGYQQKDFGQQPGLTLVISPDGAEGSLVIKQDARLYQLLLPAGGQAELAIAPGRNSYVHLVKGQLQVTDEALGPSETLQPGDGAMLQNPRALRFAAGEQAVQALVFDLP